MRYYWYESMNDCDESFVMEQEVASLIKRFWCDDCRKNHEFIAEFSCDSIEKLWELIENDDILP